MWALRKYLGMDVGGICVEAIQAAVGFNRIARAIFTISEKQLDEHEKNMIYYINMAKKCEETGVWPQNFSACAARGGCDFRHICTAKEHRRPEFLMRDFAPRERLPSGSNPN